MSPNESPGVQASNVESLLNQMTLREPSAQLDDAISKLVTTSKVNERSASGGGRFGWTAILATAAAAMLAGVWLGSFFAPTNEVHSGTTFAAVDSDTPDANLLTPVSFSVEAFNLLHGHSQKVEFKNCEHCHQAAVEDSALEEIFSAWFYGDVHFFEAHPDGLGDCSKCHVQTAELDEPAEGFGHGVGKLANCSDCHRVDADGFDGFKNDWISTTIRSDG